MESCGYIPCSQEIQYTCQTCSIVLCKKHLKAHMTSSSFPHLIQSFDPIKAKRKILLDHFGDERKSLEKLQEGILNSYSKCIRNLEKIITQSINNFNTEIEEINTQCNLVNEAAKISKYEADPVLKAFNMKIEEISDYLDTRPKPSSGLNHHILKFFEHLEEVTDYIEKNSNSVNYSYLLSLINEFENIIDEKRLFLDDNTVLLNFENRQSKKFTINVNLNWKIPVIFPAIIDAYNLSDISFGIYYKNQELNNRLYKYKRLNNINVRNDSTLKVIPYEYKKFGKDFKCFEIPFIQQGEQFKINNLYSNINNEDSKTSIRDLEDPWGEVNRIEETEKLKSSEIVIIRYEDEQGTEWNFETDINLTLSDLNWSIKNLCGEEMNGNDLIYNNRRIPFDKNCKKKLKNVGIKQNGTLLILTNYKFC
ncbi:unnamed protein product [Blepharisma stoltei]|uniref:Ubiquitin-like domain-containing protein n=1 Tax=Blepharisma stoltei TaxID=1481888 RepID=A0AAU9JPL9_9CILI|nr:unnamed protein product [Blepharisma stoltei]